MLLSVVIPAHNESGCIGETLRQLHERLRRENIPHELLVAEDHSTDGTPEVLDALKREIPTLRWVSNDLSPGYGMAVRCGLEHYRGDAACIVMADGSDDPGDVVRYYRTALEQNVDCVFGSRFMEGARVEGYPWLKLVLNRLANTFIQMLFNLRYNDVTNAFKFFRREVIDGLRPLMSRHFNLTVELPLKAIVRGYTYAVIPTAWRERRSGASKLNIKEMGSRYLFIVLYCFIEKWLARGDYHRAAGGRAERRARSA